MHKLPGYHGIDQSIRGVVKKYMRKEHKLLGDLMLVWGNVAQDIGITVYPISVQTGRNGEFSLTLGAPPADSLRASYMQDVILEKIRYYLGSQPFTSVRIISQEPEIAPVRKRRPAALANPARNYLSACDESYNKIDDESLERALKRLEQQI